MGVMGFGRVAVGGVGSSDYGWAALNCHKSFAAWVVLSLGGSISSHQKVCLISLCNLYPFGYNTACILSSDQIHLINGLPN
jgi:hypothetical protein